MMLPLAEERRNVVNMAKMLGYRVKPVTPAHVDLTFTQKVDVQLSNNAVFSDISFTIDPGKVDYDEDFLERYYKWTIDNFRYLLCSSPNDYWRTKLEYAFCDQSHNEECPGDEFYLYKFV